MDGRYLPEAPELLLERLEQRPAGRLVRVPLVREQQDWRLPEPKQRDSPAAGEWQPETQLPP